MKKLKKEVKVKAKIKADAKAEKMTKWEFKRREAKLFAELEAACLESGMADHEIIKKLAKLRKRYEGQFKRPKKADKE